MLYTFIGFEQDSIIEDYCLAGKPAHRPAKRTVPL